MCECCCRRGAAPGWRWGDAYDGTGLIALFPFDQQPDGFITQPYAINKVVDGRVAFGYWGLYEGTGYFANLIFGLQGWTGTGIVSTICAIPLPKASLRREAIPPPSSACSQTKFSAWMPGTS